MPEITQAEVILAIGDLVTVYMYSYLHRSFNTRRPWFKNHMPLGIAFYLLVGVGIFWCNMQEIPLLNFVSSIVAYFLILYVCYKPENAKGIAYYFLYLLATIVMEVAVGVGIGAIHAGMEFETQYDALSPLFSIVMNLGEIILVYGICKYGQRDRNRKGINKLTLVAMSVPVLTLALIITDYFVMAERNETNFNADQFVQMSVALLLINIFVFIILEKYSSLMSEDMKLKQEKLQMESDARILEIATESMRERLEASEETVKRDRVMRHDRRHFEALILSLLQEGKTEEAIFHLKERLVDEPRSRVQYCDNATLNATLGYYVSMAHREDIRMTISVNIPAHIKVDEMELAIVIGNLLENSIRACKKLHPAEREIKITAKYKEQLLLEIENSSDGRCVFDENGLPVTDQQGSSHGIGTKSIMAFVSKNQSNIMFREKDNKFTVRMIIEA